MKLLSALFFFLLPSTEIVEIVDAFHQLKTEKEEIAFIKSHKTSKTPEILGYVYATEMKQASYTFNPYKKLKIFKETKHKLNALIAQNPSNLHLRYIRLLLQERTPGILGNNEFIEEDKSILSSFTYPNSKVAYLYYYIQHNTSL